MFKKIRGVWSFPKNSILDKYGGLWVRVPCNLLPEYLGDYRWVHLFVYQGYTRAQTGTWIPTEEYLQLDWEIETNPNYIAISNIELTKKELSEYN